MFIDASTTPETDQTVTTCDVCIAGAGAAGITLALVLNSKGLNVVLLEGGGFDPPDSDEELGLYQGEVVYKHYPLAGSRLRYFGGSTNHWGGWCRPLDPVDLAWKDRIPLSGWPIDYAELAKWYPEANKLCEIDDPRYDAATGLSDNLRSYLIDWPAGSGFQNKLFRSSPPTRFGQRYRADVMAPKNLQCFLHCNLVDIAIDGRRVNHFKFATLSGSAGQVNASAYVLALGEIENARMLLNAAEDHPTAALGNHAGFVGRCFMDHFGFLPGQILAAAELKYDWIADGKQRIMPVISTTDAPISAGRWTNFSIRLKPEPDGSLGGGYLSSFSLKNSRSGSHPWFYSMHIISEPTPNPDSRITLSSERDALGLRRIRLDWRLNDFDFEGINRMTRELALTLGSAGLGRVRQTAFGDPVERFRATDPAHHMGTTRMSSDPLLGVVDPDCRIYGNDNLYIAGSSIFPTAGFANPTLTILAMTLRLADQLVERL